MLVVVAYVTLATALSDTVISRVTVSPFTVATRFALPAPTAVTFSPDTVMTDSSELVIAEHVAVVSTVASDL